MQENTEFQREFLFELKALILPLTIFDNDLSSSVFYSNFQGAAPNSGFYFILSMRKFLSHSRLWIFVASLDIRS